MIKIGAAQQIPYTYKQGFKNVFYMVFLEKKILNNPIYGIMHFWYLYGFIILSIGHIEFILFGITKFIYTINYNPFLYKYYLPHYIINIYEFSQDFMASGVIIAASIALYMRYTGMISRLLPRSKDAEIILLAIILLYITFFIFNTTQTVQAINNKELLPTWYWFKPINSILSLIFINLNNYILNIIHYLGMWLHLCIFLAFAIYIPKSKHLHLMAAGPNIFFKNIHSIIKPNRINFEKDTIFGVKEITDLPWKTLLDTFACTECGRCNSVCPAHLSKKPLQPKKILSDIKYNLQHHNWKSIKKQLKHKNINNTQIKINTTLITNNQTHNKYMHSGQIHINEIWACTTCAACIDICPVYIDSIPTQLINMRRNLILVQASDYPTELNTAFKNLEHKHNPWGIGKNTINMWLEKLNVPIFNKTNKKNIDYLFYIGCAGLSDDNNKKTQISLIKLLKYCKINFAILGNEEKCCGDPARRMGNEYLYDILVKDNLKILKKYKISKIFTTCPHCFNQFKNEYKDYNINIKAQHHSQLIQQLLIDGKIKIKDNTTIKQLITFHDPCYLGRYNKEYHAPRYIIKSILKTNIYEMPLSKEKSFCCGAGGGKIFMEDKTGQQIHIQRTKQALKTGANTIATACPFCSIMLKDAIKDTNTSHKLQTVDITEIVTNNLFSTSFKQ